MMSNHEKAGLFDRVKKGLEDSIAYSEGKLSLATTELPSPPPKAGPAEIASLRGKLRMSQAVFAGLVNVSVKTIQSWEQGTRQPSDAALRMIQLISSEPAVVTRIIGFKPVARKSAGKTVSRPPARRPKCKARGERRRIGSGEVSKSVALAGRLAGQLG
jgi:putative transcriptional regulator